MPETTPSPVSPVGSAPRPSSDHDDQVAAPAPTSPDCLASNKATPHGHQRRSHDDDEPARTLVDQPRDSGSGSASSGTGTTPTGLDPADVGLDEKGGLRSASDANDGFRDDKEREAFRVVLDPDDRYCPNNWSLRRQWITAGLACWFCFLAGFTGGSFSGVTPQVVRELRVSRELGQLALSIFPFGFGVAPLFLAPFSESLGRLPVYHVTFFLYLIFFVGIGKAQNIQTVIICRFIQGCCASTGSTMAAGTIADVFPPSRRGLPMSIFSLAAFAGVGSGPLCMAYVSQNIGWRWTQWIQMMSAGATFVIMVLCMKETRESVLLMRKARRKRKETGDQRWWCVPERDRVSIARLVRVSSTRAVYLLVTEPIVTAFSAWISFAWAVMWGLLSAIVLILENVYGFSQGNAGLGFTAIVVGALLAFLANPIADRIYTRRQPTIGAEARLYSAMVGGLLLPIGGFIMGWTQGNGPWIAPLIGVAILMAGVFQIYQSAFLYLADCYGPWASSAIAGQSFARNIVGGAFPLFSEQMFQGLGYQWASTLIACIGLIGAVLPFCLYMWGPKIRAKSKIASAILKAEEEAQAARLEKQRTRKDEEGTA